MAVGGNEIEGDRVGEEVVGLWVGGGESRTSQDGLLVVGSSGAGSVVGTGSCVVGTTGSFVGSLVGVPG